MTKLRAVNKIRLILSSLISVPVMQRLLNQRNLFFACWFLLACSFALNTNDSLWLDEFVTFVFTQRSSLPNLFADNVQLQHAPLYPALMWFWTKFFGVSEFSLRLPSLLAIVASSVILYRLLIAVSNQEFAAVSILFFMALPQTRLLAMDARPYSLAVLFSVISLFGLARWTKERRMLPALLCVGGAACSVMTHYLFSTIVVVQFAFFVYLLEKNRAEGRAFFRAVLLPSGLAVGAVLFRFVFLLGNQGKLSFTLPPTLEEVSEVFFPPLIVAGIAVGALVGSMFAGKPSFGMPPLERKYLVLLGILYVVPPLVIVLLSLLLRAGLMLPRYYALALPGLAVLAAAAVFIFAGRRMRVFVFSSIGLFLLIGPGGLPVVVERWRDYLVYVRERGVASDDLILLNSGFIEAKTLEWFHDKERYQNFVSPLKYYRVDGDTLVIPLLDESAANRNYVKKNIKRRTVRKRRVYFFSRRSGWEGATEEFVFVELGSLGFHLVERKISPALALFILERSGELPPASDTVEE